MLASSAIDQHPSPSATLCHLVQDLIAPGCVGVGTAPEDVAEDVAEAPPPVVEVTVGSLEVFFAVSEVPAPLVKVTGDSFKVLVAVAICYHGVSCQPTLTTFTYVYDDNSNGMFHCDKGYSQMGWDLEGCQANWPLLYGVSLPSCPFLHTQNIYMDFLTLGSQGFGRPI